MRLKYEPSSEPLHISVTQLILNRIRCCANMAHTRQSRPVSGQAKRRATDVSELVSDHPFKKRFLPIKVWKYLHNLIK